ncbi:MAG TPA: hypothetical protein PLS26_00285 [Bacteroidales bacterium]|nr:hypothetical protein [Bacteroidales bacterium]HPI28941.1 hypothetical protein [Bacteroidales bacterium]
METYICPFCKGHLNVNDNIVLLERNRHNQQGIVFLNTELGNYESQIISSIKFEKGEVCEFFCPYCHTNIEYHKEKTNLVKLLHEDEKGKITQVIFSKIYGEEATYHIDESKVMSYGEHAKKYMDPEWFLR